MKDEKGISAKDALNNLERGLTNRLTMNKNTTPQNQFQYRCSFCWRELPTGSTRFCSFGACPRCYRLAHWLVDALRGHRARYFNLGGKK
jgi:hypothetical protein